MVRDEGETACFLGDLVPTTAHLRTAWVMGYDLFPKLVMETKEAILQQAFAENWLLIFEHCSDIPCGRLVKENGHLIVRAVPE